MKSKGIQRFCWAVLLGAVVLLLTGSPGAYSLPIGHISNGSGAVETDIQRLDFGAGLKSRFSAQDIRPGEREVLAIAVAVCDGGTLANHTISILPSIASGTPTIAGGLAAVPCINLGGSDGFATGINGAVLTFSGPLAQFMGSVRMYADLDRDGTFFESSDLIEQVVPFLQGTGEAIAQFGGHQGQMMITPSGKPLAALDPTTVLPVGPPLPAFGPLNPLILLFTVDVDSSAGGGRVDVALGLQVGDDTAQKTFGVCSSTLPHVPLTVLNPTGVQNCGSNLRGGGPETTFFNITGSGGGSTGPTPTPTPTPTPAPGGSTLKAFDKNGNCKLDDSEFFSMIDGWIASSVGNTLFFASVDAWIGQSSVCSAAASDSRSGVTLSLRPSLQTALFEAHGLNIASVDVEVFSLNGTRIYAGTTPGSLLAWNLRTSSGQSLANGTYLYRVVLRDQRGTMTQSEVKKFVLIR
ncbi:hypothetical protein HY229_06595 [Candidatus Acetothermia bacterium]|nr:hypothetical protein [Candidatus Acetothermia bacterium]MBI3643751.1 hypothetical protein [Candidatus Acetothermia bacterium]